jgi:Zn-dependent peptidase ImmA (M78 family)/transcriptional regulator with XRE-family HTH domain
MFNPSRLTLARNRRGITKRRLAELIEVSDRSVTGFEAGEITPSELTLRRLSDVLRFPIGFFSADDIDGIVEDATSFRALRKMTAGQANAAIAAGHLALDLNDWIERKFRLPTLDIPALGPGIDPETAAEIVRVEWGLGEGPIPNTIHLLEAHGVRVFSLAEECREVDAFSFWRRNTPFVFLNTQKSGEHSRMDAAHELGHLVLHRHHEVIRGNREAEREAQAFAGAFLMPRHSLMASAPRAATLEQLIPIKRHWRVSLAAFVYRLHSIDLISKWQYHGYFVDMSKRGYRTEEPTPISRETSQVLNKVFRSLREKGAGKSEIAAQLHLLREDLDALVFGLTLSAVEGGSETRSRERVSFKVIEGQTG